MNNKNLHRKLNKALKDLEGKDYFTAKNFWCCSSCGWGAIANDQKDKAVFYHSQDAATLRESGTLYLSWSGSGQEIVDALNSRGLFSHWNGKDGSRIFVTESKPEKLPDNIETESIAAFFEKAKNTIKGLSKEESHLLSKFINDAKQDGLEFDFSNASEPERDDFIQTKINEYNAKLILKDKKDREIFSSLISKSILDGMIARLEKSKEERIERQLKNLFEN